MKFSKIAAILILAFSVQVHAEKVNINFANLSVNDFVKMVGKITGKNILIDGEIKGKINFVANEEGVEKDELIPLLNAILETKKMTLVNKGSYYQVVKSATAAGEGLPVTNNINTGERTMKTVVFQLSNVNAAVIRTKIKPLLHKSAKVVSFKKNNLLSITAYPSTLRSIKTLIDKIESKQAKKSKIVHLENARVKDVFPNIQNMAKSLFPQDIISEKVDVLQDISGNAIILIGKSSNVNRLEQYIRQLDTEGEGDLQKMHVIPLANSNVEEMEKILSKIVPQMTGTGGPTGAAGKGGKPIQKAVIASDLERNALIVLANAEQYQNILDTVKQLDVEKSQVYIQAKIVEVNTNLAENIGIKYGLNGGSITSNGLFSLAANAGAPALALSSELLGFLNGNQQTQFDNNGNAFTTTERAFEFGSVDKVFALGAQVDLLKQNGAAQILSRPSVLSTNNKESTIYVGRTQSILTQSQQSTQGASNVLNNYSREDIGITLKVKPRLSANDKVSLEIETTIEDILPGSGTSADRPTTTKRSVQTNAIINHAETIILGGLIKSADGNSVTKVPVLGDIPIIGKLFTSRGDSASKVNVVIYITPYIIKKSSDLTSLRERLAELESVQQQYNKIIMAQLEEETGESSNPRHETFSGSSSIGNDFEDDNVESMRGYQPVIEAKAKPRPIVQAAPAYVATPAVAPVVTAPLPPLDYSDESNYVRSESIMDSFNQQDSVDLSSLNTGVEYNEGTTFTDVQPTPVATQQYSVPTSQKVYSIQLASSNSQNRVNRIISNFPANMQNNIRVIKVGNLYKALALNAQTFQQAKTQLAQYRSYIPDAFIKAAYPLSEERL
ncbi:MAG: General secretion pathway protein D / Type II secretion outermembrane pore forming protein (PulD) [uncultured Sulfurovum sp.]|uniref:General secretion pathway protein D / Type II secretion outermembrane pore forming protein (PulD) n=1 Tax=uncultured Sulfurovum sp. TaxID=269237 RepID=A0A6S6TAF6_9BACT|nr:MAG: General secretion pathway protein D / Type II secretion outermembrane pore forming protein (PulD) [uncultured Sulfurovum sp.]